MSTLVKLATPQEPWPVTALSQLFKKYANSSIMKLDEASMLKLVYLVVMSAKKQIFLISSPLEIYSLSLGHLITLRKSIPETEEYMFQIISKYKSITQSLCFMQYLQVKEQILSQTEEFQSKIINFLESGFQNEQGKLIFIERNTHNRTPINQNCNHPKISYPQQAQTAKLHPLPLEEYQKWISSLVINYAEEYQKQSERRSKPPKNQPQINHFFSIDSQSPKFIDYQVKIDLFQSKNLEDVDIHQSEDKGKQVVQEAKGKKSSQEGSKIHKKINQQFDEVKGVEEEEELDLLDIMDN